LSVGGEEAHWAPYRVPPSVVPRVLNALALAFAYLSLLFVINVLTEFFPVLRWATGVLAIGVVVMCVVPLVTRLRVEIKRADTATQTIRAASQGRIELVGRVAAIGEPAGSPLFDVPAVSWWSSLDCFVDVPAVRAAPDGRQDLSGVTFTETRERSFLLSDGDRAVFVPFDLRHRFDASEQLADIEAPFELLRRDILDRIAGRPVHARTREETVVPIGMAVQANGVLRTFLSSDPYMPEYARRTGAKPPTEAELGRHPIEADWREFCRAEEARRGGDPVPVDALLPLSARKRVPVTRHVHASRVDAALFVLECVAIMIPPIALLAYWLDLAPSPFGPLLHALEHWL